MFERIARWFAGFKPAVASAERAEGCSRAEVAVKPTERVSIDCAEVQRLRAAGVSWRNISRLLPGTPPQSTVRYQFEQWLLRQQSEPVPAVPSPAVPTDPKPPVCLPESLAAGLSSLAVPVAAEAQLAPVSEASAPEPEVDTSAVFGLDSVPTGCRAFFLVRGAANAELARNMAQPTIGIARWNPAYWRLPVFQKAQKFWIVLNAGDDGNEAFLRSLVGDAQLRALSLIAMPRPWVTVQSITRDRLLAQRRLGNGYSDRIDFESPNGFQPLPPLGPELAEWLPKPEKAEPWVNPLDYREPWMLPQQRWPG